MICYIFFYSKFPDIPESHKKGGDGENQQMQSVWLFNQPQYINKKEPHYLVSLVMTNSIHKLFLSEQATIFNQM